MAFGRPTGPGVSMLAAATALLAFAVAAPHAGAAGKSCRLYADAKPRKLSKQHARSAVVCVINGRRSKHGLSPLKRHKKLQRAAQRHTERMEGGNCLAHQCPGEASLEGRLADVGYLVGGLEGWVLAENVAWGFKRRGSPRAIVKAWMQSAPHRSTILSGTFRDIGAGFADGTPSDAHGNGGVYTVDFGVRRR
jgi:uncharacterized protein YkwD